MSTLLLYLQDNDQIDYQDRVNGEVLRAEQQPLDTLPDTLRGHTATVIVPGCWITMHMALIPETASGRLAQVVPYALEDYVIDDIEDLHFAFDKFTADKLLPVAVVRNSQMQHWQTILQNIKITADKLLPDYLALPLELGTWQIYLYQDSALIRFNAHLGTTISIKQLPQFLNLKLEEAFIKPTAIHIAYDAHNVQYNRALLNDTVVACTHAPQPIAATEFFATGLKTSPALNLLQGLFSKNQSGNQSRLWRWCGYVAAACALAWAAGSVAQYIMLNKQLTTVQQQVATAYHQVFPNQAVVNPEARIQEVVNDAISARAGGKFLSVLGITGEQLQKQHDVTLNSLNFEGNSIILGVQSASFEHLSALTKALQAQQLQVTQSNAHTTSDGVTAQLTISRGGA